MIDIIVPVYNGVDFLKQCIESVEKETHTDTWQLVIADDNSPDPETQEYLKGLKHQVIKNKTERGFPANCNYAVSKTWGEFIVLLNSDTVVTDGWLQSMLDEMENPEVAVVGSKLIFPKSKKKLGGRLQHAGVCRNASGYPYHPFYGGDPDDERVNVRRELNCVTFACAMIRRSVWDALHGLDREFTGGQFEDVDFCLPRHTLISTPDGVVPIGDLREGDVVLNRYGRPTHVTNTMQREFGGKMITVRRFFGDDLCLTDNHPVYTKDGWKRADALTTNDWLWQPTTPFTDGNKAFSPEDWFPEDICFRREGDEIIFKGQHKDTNCRKMPESIIWDERFSRIAGYYLAEGCIANRWCQVDICFNENRTDLMENLRRDMLDLFGAIPTEKDAPGCRHLIYCSKALALMLGGMFGKGSHNKHFPFLVSNIGVRARIALLEALWKCDGYSGSRASYGTVSPHLAYQIPMLAASLGFVVGTRRTQKGTAYELSVSKWQEEAFRQCFHLPLGKLAKESVLSPTFELGEQNGYWYKISKVSAEEKRMTVYNISTTDEHYLAEGVLVHNCWRVRRKGHKIVYTPKSVVYHYEHGAGENFVSETEGKNLRLLLQKWGNLGSDEDLMIPIGLANLDTTEMRQAFAAYFHMIRGAAMLYAWDIPKSVSPKEKMEHCHRLANMTYDQLPQVEKDWAMQWAVQFMERLKTYESLYQYNHRQL